jgi:hypothetical protein
MMNSFSAPAPQRSYDEVASVPAMRIAVGIATCGRPEVLAGTLAQLRRLSCAPSVIFVSYAEEADIGRLPYDYPEVIFLKGERGLTRQRNRILSEAVSRADILTFFDDDFYTHPQYLDAIQTIFRSEDGVVAATGLVLMDGINGPGIRPEAAIHRLDKWNASESPSSIQTVFNAYGCNMSFRIAPIVERKLSFDELLPLYGWYEDVGFSRSLAPFGRIVRVDAAVGIHLGVKGGRQSGVRLGYSQIANPIYLARTGLVSWSYALASMCSRTAKNSVRAFFPERWVDRRGRLQGNLLGWRDASLGRSHPTRITHL